MRAKIPAPLRFFSYNALEYTEEQRDSPEVKKNIETAIAIFCFHRNRLSTT